MDMSKLHATAPFAYDFVETGRHITGLAYNYGKR
jgi:hypothetical protein